MRLLSLAVVALFALSAVATLSAVSQRTSGVRTVGTGSEPLIVDAQAIDTDLSQANAIAANAFLGGGIESPAQRSAYQSNIQAATTLVADAARRSGTDSQSAGSLQTLADQIPVYTGLVETARANNRQGFPVGAAYLRQASALMSNTILPAAQKLYSVDAARLDGGNAKARNTYNTTLVSLLLLLILFGGAGAQIWMGARTNRLLNLPLLGATLLAVILLVITVSDMRSEAAQSAQARDSSYAKVNVVAQARIAAFRAKGDESLTLIGRGNGSAFEDDFKAQLAKIPSLLDAAHVPQTALQAYVAVHHQIRTLDDGGQFDQAVALAVGGGQSSAANQAFTALDTQLSDALHSSQSDFVAHERAARRHLRGLIPAILIVMIFACALALYGLQQRINEYR